MQSKSIGTLLLLLVVSTTVTAQWTRIAQPVTRDFLKVSFIDSTTGWACGREGIIYRTTNGGVSWTAQNSTLTTDINAIFMTDARHGYALSWIYYQNDTTFHGSKILKTVNSGDTWVATEFPITGKYFHAITFFDSLNGWIGGEEGAIFKTSDGGTTWIQANVDSSFHMNFSVLNITFYSKQYGYAMGGALDFAGVIWRTTNGGERWTAFGISPEPVYEVYYVDSLHVIGIAGDFDFGASMVRSYDGGNRWEWIYLEHFGQPKAMSWRTHKEAWVPIGNQLMFTHDTAYTWQVTEPFGWRTFYDLVFTDSSTGYAVTDSGFVYKYSNRPTSVDQPGEPSVPAATRLHPNYPNPFNPSTTISYTLGTAGPIDLGVYDVLGRRIATIAQGEKVRGTHLASWNASSFPSGVYFLRLTAGKYTEVKKMLLAR